MNIKILATAMAMAVATVGLAPTNANAGSNHHHKKAIKKRHKQQKKRYKQQNKHHDGAHHNNWNSHSGHNDWNHNGGNHGWKHRKRKYRNRNHGWNHRPDHIKIKYDYDYPDNSRENYGIYTTPGGGLGLFYSETEGPSYGNPYRRGPYNSYGFSFGL